jgi:hypothetical protein
MFVSIMLTTSSLLTTMTFIQQRLQRILDRLASQRAEREFMAESSRIFRAAEVLSSRITVLETEEVSSGVNVFANTVITKHVRL